MSFPVPNSEDLPIVNSAIYIQWDEADSEEPPGWYYVTVKQYFSDGKAEVEYRDLVAMETLDLRSTQWKLTRKGQKPYLPLQTMPPNFPLKNIRTEAAKVKTCTFASHTGKGFADDLTVLSLSAQDYVLALSEIKKKCRDVDLTLRPDKCVTIIFDGNKMDQRNTSLSNGHTRNITKGPSSILGHVIGSTTLKLGAASAKKLESKLLSAIKRIDERPIREEYKIWILKNYVAPSIQFLLIVDLISENSLLTTQKKISKYIKSWLTSPAVSL